MLLLMSIAHALPTPADEERLLADLVAANEDARAVMVATSAAHHAWTPSRSCDPTHDSTAVRARRLLDAWRAVVVRATRLADQLVAAEHGPTLAPLRTQAREAAIGRQVATARAGELTWRGSAAWHAKELAPYTKRCSPVLTPAEGWVDPTLPAVDDLASLTAILVTAPGVLCGAAEPLDVAPGVVLVDALPTCWSDTVCDCVPAEVLPGAVLGQQTR